MRKTALLVPLRHTSWHVLGRSCEFQASGCDLEGSYHFLSSKWHQHENWRDAPNMFIIWSPPFTRDSVGIPIILDFFCSVLPDSPGPPLPGWAGPGPESASPPTTGGGASGPSQRPPQRETPPAKWTAPAEGQIRTATVMHENHVIIWQSTF